MECQQSRKGQAASKSQSRDSYPGACISQSLPLSPRICHLPRVSSVFLPFLSHVTLDQNIMHANPRWLPPETLISSLFSLVVHLYQTESFRILLSWWLRASWVIFSASRSPTHELRPCILSPARPPSPRGLCPPWLSWAIL